ncbi:hypothetical protein J7643_11680 [bacterium]|nr:hypothetical protein [bacterium]
MKKLIATLGLLMLLPACHAAPAAPAGSPAGNASVTVRPQVIAGERTTQAVVSPYTAASIHHLTLKLYKFQGGTETEKASKDIVGPIDSQSVTFGNLSYDSYYRIRAYAYATDGTSAPISVDAESMLDFDVADNNAITLPPVPVQLKNVMFSGTGNATGLEVLPGYLGHSGSETID